jgi:hypothetical protein
MPASYDGIRDFGDCKRQGVGKLWIEKTYPPFIVAFFPQHYRLLAPAANDIILNITIQI